MTIHQHSLHNYCLCLSHHHFSLDYCSSFLCASALTPVECYHYRNQTSKVEVRSGIPFLKKLFNGFPSYKVKTEVFTMAFESSHNLSSISPQSVTLPLYFIFCYCTPCSLPVRDTGLLFLEYASYASVLRHLHW